MELEEIVQTLRSQRQLFRNSQTAPFLHLPDRSSDHHVSFSSQVSFFCTHPLSPIPTLCMNHESQQAREGGGGTCKENTCTFPLMEYQASRQSQ